MFCLLTKGLTKSVEAPRCSERVFFFSLSHLCMINLAPLVSESSLKRNDSELLYRTGSWKSGTS